MREILFRGKRTSDKEWIFGNLLQFDDEVCIIQNYPEFKDLGKYRVYRKSVSQYVGMADKNGIKIFEGDIVECVYDGNMNVRLIVWDNDELDFKGTNGKEHYETNFDYLPCCEELVVIGNIFDNPELLKEDTENTNPAD